MDRGILDATRAAQSKAAGRLLDSADIDNGMIIVMTP